MSQYEIKNTSFELKEITPDGVIIGYGAVFENVDNGNDIIKKGAFTRTLNSGGQVKMLWQHKKDEPIGVWTDIKADDYGLLMTGQLALSTQKGRDTYELVKMGALDGLSIGFITLDESYNLAGQREINEVKLKEVSVVTFPCNEEATVLAVKSDKHELNVEQIKQVSEFIRELSGMPEPIPEEPENTSKPEVKEDKLSKDISDILMSEDINKLTK